MKEYHAIAAPAFAGATGGSSLRQRLQPVILVIIPDLALQNLARRGVRQFVDADDFVGQPPISDLVLPIIEDVRLADLDQKSAVWGKRVSVRVHSVGQVSSNKK